MILPGVNNSNLIGNLAVTRVQQLFEENNCLFRRQDSVNDFGIDSEVELVDKNRVTGKLFKLQIKGTSKIEWNNNVSSVQVKVATFNLWQSIQLPVIALLVDMSNNEVYWNIPIQQSVNSENVYFSLHFFHENELAKSFLTLASVINSWYQSFSKISILQQIPIFELFYNEIAENIDGGDPWCGIPQEIEYKTRLFYVFVIQLRSCIGLLNTQIPSIDIWYLRNRAIWDEDSSLNYTVFSELLKFITPFYFEAKEKIISRLKNIELTFETTEIVNYYKHNYEGMNQNTSYRVGDSRIDNKEFHQAFEKILQEKNALSWSYFRKKEID